MDHLWAPWRLSYVAAAKPPTGKEPCFICQGLAEDNDRSNLIALRKPHTAVILNRYPYNNGHLLVAPRAHKADLADLTDTEMVETMQTLQDMVQALRKIIQPHGFNMGLNLGKVAGAGLPGHLHWHIVPRWEGDTNFMPVIGDSRVIVQSLDTFYDLLWKQIHEKI